MVVSDVWVIASSAGLCLKLSIILDETYDNLTDIDSIVWENVLTYT